MKYIGSKAKVAADIVPILQGYINEYGIKQYVEPFVGGFNIIDKIECKNRLGNDIDPLVCELVETCRENPALLDGLKTPTREEYYDVRDNPEKYAGWYRAAVLLFASYNARVYGGCYDYRQMCFPTREKVLIYCDPPYAEGVGYVKHFDTAAFWQWCRERAAEGHIVVVSEYTAPPDFACVWERNVKTHLNNRAKRDRVEKLFVYGGGQWQR